MKCLVIGGAGYIGGVTTHLLHEAGHEVIVLDNLSTGHKKNIPDGVEHVEGDMGDSSLVSKLLSEKNIEVVLHFAAKIRVDESMENPKMYFDNNTVSALTIIDTAVKAKVNGYIFSSTAAVYGEPESIPINEDDPTSPVNPYGFSKFLTENILRSYQYTHDLNWLAFRYFNATGAYNGVGPEYPFKSHLISMLLEAMATNKTFKIFGNDYDTPDGTAIRDFVHVWDIARAHVIAAEKMAGDKKLQTVINLGSSKGYSVEEIVKQMEKIIGHDIDYEYADRRPGDPSKIVANFDKANKLLGWKPEKSIGDILKDSLEWDSNLKKS